MLRMWVKFKEQDGKKVIDRATFQTFGCQTAIAVASVATELIAGKTVDEALSLSGEELAAPLGALPPMKIHCAQLVEGALRSALAPTQATIPVSGTNPPAPFRRPRQRCTIRSPARDRRPEDEGRAHEQAGRAKLIFSLLFSCTKTPKSSSTATWRPSRSRAAISSPCLRARRWSSRSHSAAATPWPRPRDCRASPKPTPTPSASARTASRRKSPSPTPTSIPPRRKKRRGTSSRRASTRKSRSTSSISAWCTAAK